MAQNQLKATFHSTPTTQSKLPTSEIILQKQATALFQLMQSEVISQGKLDQAFQEITETTSTLLEVERASVWLLDEQSTKIQCADLFQQSEKFHSNGFELKAIDYPAYFQAVMSTPMLAAHDALTDPRTAEFVHGYLDVFNISSMLDASIYVEGKRRGVICCEHVGKSRIWSTAEKFFIRSIANVVALTLEANQRQQKATKLEQAMLQLENSQLKVVQYEKMASLGNLVAGVAHEINNPLGFLNGSIRNAQNYLQDLFGHLALYQQHYPQAAESVQENAEDIDLDFLLDDFPKLLDAMIEANQRIKSISTSLRSFSRADTDHKVSADLLEGIDSTLLILRYRLKANENRPEIQIIKDYGELPAVDCFPGQLNQVFMNLLANAIDAFDEAAQQLTLDELKNKPQTVTIKAAVLTEAKEVEICIGDNGKGMSKAVKDRIFDHLFTTKAIGKGTGLGLAITKQIIVEAHGGTIEVRSALGQGTEFCIRVPLSGELVSS